MTQFPIRRFKRLPMVLAVAATTLTADFAVAQLEEIVVTAQRRSESVQDIPVSVTAFDAAKLKATNISRTSDLSAQTPNLQAVDGNFGLAAPIISVRGVSNTDFSAISNTPVSVYSDDMLLNNVQTHGFAMFDLERVEILRGPQGTLFGRNSTTGAMQVISNKPSDEFESGVDVTVGQHGRQQVEGFVSGPIVEDKVLGRLALSTNRSDGFVKDQAGNNAQEQDVMAARSTFDFLISDELTARFKLQYQTVDNTPIVFHNTSPTNAFDPNAAPGGSNSNFRKVVLNQDYRRQEKSETIGSSFSVDWDFSDNASLTAVTSYLDHDMRYQNDEDASTSRLTHSQAFTDQKQFTQEFRIHAEFGDLDVVGGLFYLKENVDAMASFDVSAVAEGTPSYAALLGVNAGDVDFVNSVGSGVPVGQNLWAAGDFLAAAIAANPGAGIGAGSMLTLAQGTRALQNLGLLPAGDASAYNGFKYSQDLESVALFSHMKYTISDELSATLGLRYTRDEKEIDGISRPCTLVQDPQNPGILSKNAALTGRNIIFSSTVCPGTRTVSDSESWDAFTGKLGLEYRVSDDILAYVNYSKGFKGGSFDGADSGTIRVVDPEKLTSYELGVKTSWLENRLVMNAAYFYYDYQDFQAILATILPGQLLANNVTFNVPESRIQGAEIEVSSELIDNLNISLGFSWVESRVLKAPNLDFDPNAPDIKGNEFRYAPGFTFNGAISYNFNLGELGYLKPQVDWVFNDEYYTDVVNRDNGKVDDVWKTNARLAWSSPDEQYYATAFIENLENKVIVTSNSTAFLGSAGTSYSTVSSPRTFGLSFGARF